MLNDILLQVNKPGRYIGGEWNASAKDFDKAGVKFALAFADLYEVGMSNLGIRILYGILNAMEGVCCERFFSCWHDMEGILRQKGMEIVSLESRRRMKEFDIAGFSLGSELCYTNVLAMLELGGIPLESCLRGSEYPLIIAGGPCALNPEPMHEFFDLVFVGEAEDTIPAFIEAYRIRKEDYKRGRINKQELLSSFTAIDGIYVPSLYNATYASGGMIDGFTASAKGLPLKINKTVVKDLDKSFFPVDWLVPYIQIVHDRITLEIMRGCPNRCRFCQARSQYFPVRFRGIGKIMELAEHSYAKSGYEEVSLGGLSVSDYPRIEELLENLGSAFNGRGVCVSLPSIKAKKAVGRMASLIARLKKTGLTFAPEAGTERLRRAIAKDFDENVFFDSLKEAYSSGYQHIKLYFMVGLPSEEKSDLDGIIDFAMRASDLKRQVQGGPAAVNLSVNTFIPKPHTPLQWFNMDAMDTIKEKQAYLKSRIRSRRLKINFQEPCMSLLEAILSRGDRRLSRVIASAFKKGARFDAWSDSFSFQAWLDAFRECGVEPERYLQGYPEQAMLPWDFIDTGIDKHTLLEEFNKTVVSK